MIKKAIIFLFSCFLLYQFCTILYAYLFVANHQNFDEPTLFFLGWVLNLMSVGIFGISGTVFKTNKALPASYYLIRNPERINAIYKVLGVHYFRLALLFFYWGKKKKRKQFFNGTKQGLKNFLFQSRQAEFGHLGALIITFIGTLFDWVYGHFQLGIYMTLINIIGNLYPIILQRYHRVRIQRVIAN